VTVREAGPRPPQGPAGAAGRGPGCETQPIGSAFILPHDFVLGKVTPLLPYCTAPNVVNLLEGKCRRGFHDEAGPLTLLGPKKTGEGGAGPDRGHLRRRFPARSVS
jgi:hypothetical protein